MKKISLFFHKLTHWEYWSMNIIYFPLLFVWLYYAIKAKSLFFFGASNPLIKNGGFAMESKREIYDLIPSKYYPKTIYPQISDDLTQVLALLKNNNMPYPIIAKPDIGLRGIGVSKIENELDLHAYIKQNKVDYMFQEYINYEHEVGIFYVRFPNEKKGFISGIVLKEFLIVEGDGISTIEQLIHKDPRYLMQLPVLQKVYGEKLQVILPLYEKKNLVPYGNHSRGAKFLDISEKISSTLTETFNEICLEIPHFYFGRLDIKYNIWEELEVGKNFSIIELNGASSEPTHIYDPKHSIFFAWKEIVSHWDYLYTISKMNHQNGFQYLSFSEAINMIKQHNDLLKKILL